MLHALHVCWSGWSSYYGNPPYPTFNCTHTISMQECSTLWRSVVHISTDIDKGEFLLNKLTTSQQASKLVGIALLYLLSCVLWRKTSCKSSVPHCLELQTVQLCYTKNCAIQRQYTAFKDKCKELSNLFHPLATKAGTTVHYFGEGTLGQCQTTPEDGPGTCTQSPTRALLNEYSTATGQDQWLCHTLPLVQSQPKPGPQFTVLLGPGWGAKWRRFFHQWWPAKIKICEFKIHSQLL